MKGELGMNSETRNSLDSQFDIKPQLLPLVHRDTDTLFALTTSPQQYLATVKKILEAYHRRKIKEQNLIKDYIRNRAVDVERCINERRPLYLVGHTQSNKTQFIEHLTTLSLNKNWTDVVIIATTNMLDAKDLLYRRIVPACNNQRRSVYTTDNLPSRITPGDVIVTMSNDHRTKLLRNLITSSASIDRDNGHPPLRYLYIHDEADESEAAAGNPNYTQTKAQVEHELFQLLYDSSVPINYVKVSATLMSAICTSGKWVSTYNDLQAYQVFELPLSADYFGLNSSKMPIVRNLVPEDKRIFNRSSLLSACQYPSDSKNISTIVDAVVGLSNSCAFNMTQIGNVVYGTSMQSHVRMASLIAKDVHDRYGLRSAVWNTDSLTSLPRNTQVLCIVQNGDVRPRASLEERLREAADYFDHLVIIFICADKMTNKSITIDSGYDSGLYDPTSRRFGYYCNFTVLYAPKTAVEPCIQYLRCTGNRPPLKQHVVYTLPSVAKDIHSYVDDQAQNLANLRTCGEWKDEHTLIFRISERGLGKKRVNSRMHTSTSDSKEPRGTDITVTTRQDLVSTHGYYEIDQLYPLTRQEFMSATTRQDIIDLANTKGFTGKMPFASLYAPTDIEIRVNRSQSIPNWKDADTWRANIEMARNNNIPAKWTLTVFSSNGKYFLHFRNNMIWNYFKDKYFKDKSNARDCVKYTFKTHGGELHIVGAVKYCLDPNSRTRAMWKAEP